jgi:hypothetical protein
MLVVAEVVDLLLNVFEQVLNLADRSWTGLVAKCSFSDEEEK